MRYIRPFVLTILLTGCIAGYDPTEWDARPFGPPLPAIALRTDPDIVDKYCAGRRSCSFRYEAEGYCLYYVVKGDLVWEQHELKHCAGFTHPGAHFPVPWRQGARP